MQYYQKIKNEREDKDIRQCELAEKYNISKKSYNLYENGFRSFPLNILNNVLKDLNISLDYILGLTKTKNYENTKDIDINKVQENIIKYRKLNNLSQRDLANKINISQQSISRYENQNDIETIPIEIIKSLALTFKISADTLTGRIEKEIKLDTFQTN